MTDFWETFYGRINLLSEFLSEMRWEEIEEEIFSNFRFDVVSGVWTRTLRLKSQYTICGTTATSHYILTAYFLNFGLHTSIWSRKFLATPCIFLHFKTFISYMGPSFLRLYRIFVYLVSLKSHADCHLKIFLQTRDQQQVCETISRFESYL